MWHRAEEVGRGHTGKREIKFGFCPGPCGSVVTASGHAPKGRGFDSRASGLYLGCRFDPAPLTPQKKINPKDILRRGLTTINSLDSVLSEMRSHHDDMLNFVF